MSLFSQGELYPGLSGRGSQYSEVALGSGGGADTPLHSMEMIYIYIYIQKFLLFISVIVILFIRYVSRNIESKSGVDMPFLSC